jgi:hypothetical protein
MVTWLVGGALAGAASAAGAQPAPQSHEQHQAPRQQQVAAQHQLADRCRCEEMMRKMMMEMQVQKGMGTAKQRRAA